MQHTTIALQRSILTSKEVTFTVYLFVALTFFVTKTAFSQTSNNWSTSAHLGYGINQESTTGFDNVGGSMMFLDLFRTVSHDWDIGMRTIAQGGEESRNEYYRMGVGPFISYNFNEKWRGQFSVSFFNETANDETRERAYKSRGRTYQIGWERCRELMKNLELAWGGFYMVHHGDISLSEGTSSSSATANRFANISTNRGATRGVEMALRFKL